MEDHVDRIAPLRAVARDFDAVYQAAHRIHEGGATPGLDPHLVDRLAELLKAADQVRDLRGRGPLLADLAISIDDADRY